MAEGAVAEPGTDQTRESEHAANRPEPAKCDQPACSQTSVMTIFCLRCGEILKKSEAMKSDLNFILTIRIVIIQSKTLVVKIGH